MQNLWADFSDNGQIKGDEERGGGFRQRRFTEQATLMILRAWLLEEYVLPYGTSLSNTRIFQRCYWLDALGNAGPLPYASPPPGEEQSPTKRGRKKALPAPAPQVMALQPVIKVAGELAQLTRPFTLHGLVLDKRAAGKRKGTVQVDEKPVLPRESGLLPVNWSDFALSYLSLLEQSAAIFLLNPLKDGLFSSTDLLPLYQRTAPTELFLWFSHKQIETRLLPTLRTPAGAASLTNVLRSDRWKKLLTLHEGNEDTAPLISGLLERFAESMRPHFLSVQQLAFPLHTGPALVEGGPYSLLFATRRQDSLASLNDAVCNRQRRLVIASQRGILSESWFVAQREEQARTKINELTQEILTLGRLHRPRRWPEFRQQLLQAHFGEATQQDYNQVILNLLARGEVICEWRSNASNGEANPIPGNQDLLHWK